MTTFHEEGSADTRGDDLVPTVDDPSGPVSGPVPGPASWPADGGTARGQADGEPLMGAVLDLVHDLDERVTHLTAALQSNRRIGIALGIVMSQNRISDEDAFVALRQVSQRTNRKLRDVAEDVIYAGHLDVGA